MKVKLKIDKVLNGSVWPAGSVVDVSDDEGKQLIEARDADAVSTATGKKEEK